MEHLTMAFMAAVVGCLLWIGSELHQVGKKLKVKDCCRNTRNGKPQKGFQGKRK